MKKNYLDYPLKAGYVINWLVVGPEIVEINGEADYRNEYAAIINEKFGQEKPQAVMEIQPVEREAMTLGKDEARWQYFRCKEDFLVHFPHVVKSPSLIKDWAYCSIKLPEPTQVTFEITSRSPVYVWHNGNLVVTQADFRQVDESYTFNLSLEKENDILVRIDNLAAAETNAYFSLRAVHGLQAEMTDNPDLVRLPTPAYYPHRYKIFEEMFEHALLNDVVNHWGTTLQLRWADGYSDENHYRFQVQDESGGFVVEGNAKPDHENPLVVGHPYRLFEKKYWVTLTPTIREYGNQWIRYTKRFPVNVLDTAYSTNIYGSPASRRDEALKDASKHEKDVFAMVARLELGQWDGLLKETVTASVDMVNRRLVGSEETLCGLLMMVNRFTNPTSPDGSQPESLAALRDDFNGSIRSAAINYRYWQDDAGKDALTFENESSQILFHACEILAGQMYGDVKFGHTGKKGSWHKQRGEQLAVEWMKQRLTSGFKDWNSNSEWHRVILALAQIFTFAENESVKELSAVLLDKMVFLMAVNSYKGVFGCSHGKTHADMMRSAQLEATSGIMRQLWGCGVFNHYISGTVGLACSDYEFPSFFKDIATDIPEESLSLEKQVSPDGRSVNTVTFKTPDYMLSAAQDFMAGEHGKHEHIWQATLGPEAIVYTTHPSNSSEEPGSEPGYWLGNGRLPRVFQRKDLVIALYNLDSDDILGFTHAYFPTPAFDEYKIDSQWKFLRKGDGYLAICAAKGCELTKKGQAVLRELRSYGLQNTWVCQLGRKDQDGNFEEFMRKVNDLKMNWHSNGVDFKSLRGETISINWDTPFILNGDEMETTHQNHIENPYTTAGYPAKSMDIQYTDYLLRLNFS